MPDESIVYQIRDWNSHFENNKSRERDACSWVPIPNKQDGLGYGTLLRMPNGPALYGAFVAVVLVASKQCSPRDGHLTDTGRADGCPHTAETLSIKTQMPEKLISEMLTVCSSERIGWITTYTSARKVPARCPPGAPSGKEEKAENPKKGSEEKDSPSAAASGENFEPLKDYANVPEMVAFVRRNHREFARSPEHALVAVIAKHRGKISHAQMVQRINDMVVHYAGDADLKMPAPRRLDTYLEGRKSDRQEQIAEGTLT